MNPGFVADSSVAMAWVVRSQSSQAAELLNDVETGTPFFVPVLWMFEVANARALRSARSRN
jgi:predicted nucleic acid-binding protein